MDAEAVRALASADSREREYWMHVAAQHELPLAGVVEVRQHLARVDTLVAAPRDLTDSEAVQAGVAAALLEDPDLLDEARQLVSVKDKRAYLDLSYLFSRTIDPSDATKTLCGCAPHELKAHQLNVFKTMLRPGPGNPRAEKAAAVIAEYLLDTKGLGSMLQIYAELSAGQRAALMTHLVIPGEMQQREAKRRGHGAEAELARVVMDLGCSILPEGKVTNPVGAADPNVDLTTLEVVPRDAETTESFDLIVCRAGQVAVCVQSLIQSSDPGQFGVNKAKATGDARTAIDTFNAKTDADASRAVRLWGLIDGVGYAENKAGTLNPMLGQVHCFLQLKSLFKAACELHKLDLCELVMVRFDSAFYSESAYEQMATYVPSDVAHDLGEDAPDGSIRAGMAWVVPRG